MNGSYATPMDLKSRIGKTSWFDLPVKDAVNARSFYEGLFNWTFLVMKDAPVTDYWVIQAGDELIGGIRQMSDRAGGSPAPILYFTVDDLARYSRRVTELGGKLSGKQVDLGKGRGAYQWFHDRENNLAALWAPTGDSL